MLETKSETLIFFKINAYSIDRKYFINVQNEMTMHFVKSINTK